MSSKAFWRVVAITVVAVAALVGGIAHTRGLGPLGASRATGAAEEVERGYREALEIVEANYAGEVEFERASEAAIQGMLWSLDPHSNFFTAADYAKLLQDQESRFTGIGVSIQRHRDAVYVQSPVEGTPAARAGLRFGDRIVEVDGKNAREWTTAQVSKAVRGERGKRVTLKVERAGSEAPLYFTIVRDSVPQPSVRNAFMIRPGVGYVALTGGFTQTTTKELRDAFERLRGEGMRQVVLDLRNNGGGLLEQSVNVASLFVGRGQTVVTVRGRADERTRVLKNQSTDPVEFPLVVLINRNSASASEIVAGAIQDHGRGLIVGETSFGKGLVQKVFPLPFGAGLTLTTAKYYTPYGRLIQREYTGGTYYDYYARREDEAAPANGTVAPGAPATPGSPSQPSQTGAPSEAPTPEPIPHASPTGPPITTAAGRVFYGGGGITPDHHVRPLDLGTPARVRIYDASFHFTRELAAGRVGGLESYRVPETPQFGRAPRATDFPVTDRVVEAFRDFVRRGAEPGLSVAALDADLDFARMRLREDIITAAFGLEAGARVTLDTDPQALRALEVFPEARTLAENVRRGGPAE
ncbi:MAG TPA: S41 family peptidase [Pyrinomonadaceae bacterium]|nr:S41 family peptidase [Pyrinomonadaceae bacterium]